MRCVWLPVLRPMQNQIRGYGTVAREAPVSVTSLTCFPSRRLRVSATFLEPTSIHLPDRTRSRARNKEVDERASENHARHAGESSQMASNDPKKRSSFFAMRRYGVMYCAVLGNNTRTCLLCARWMRQAMEATLVCRSSRVLVFFFVRFVGCLFRRPAFVSPFLPVRRMTPTHREIVCPLLHFPAAPSGHVGGHRLLGMEGWLYEVSKAKRVGTQKQDGEQLGCNAVCVRVRAYSTPCWLLCPERVSTAGIRCLCGSGGSGGVALLCMDTPRGDGASTTSRANERSAEGFGLYLRRACLKRQVCAMH